MLLVTHAFPPQGNVGVIRILKFCKYLPQYGWASSVLTHRPRPGYDVIDRNLLRDVPAGTRIVRAGEFDPTYVWHQLRGALAPLRARTAQTRKAASAPTTVSVTATAASNNWKRSLRVVLAGIPDRQAGWLFSAVFAGLSEARRCQCIVATNPPFTTLLVGLLLHRLSNRPLVLDFRDPWSFNPWLPKHPSWWPALNARLEAACVQRAACIISSTREIENEFRRRYPHLPADRFATIPNGFDPDDLPSAEIAAPSPPPQAPMTVAYFGKLYGNRDPEPLLRAMKQIRDQSPNGAPPIQFRLYGPPSPQALDRASDLGLADAVEYCGQLPYRDALVQMRQESVLLILGAADSDVYCVATKTYEYLSARRPVLALVPEGPISTIIGAGEQNRVAPPTDVDAIARALNAMRDRHTQGELGATTGDGVSKFDRSRLTGDLARVLDQISAGQLARRRAIERRFRRFAAPRICERSADASEATSGTTTRAD